MFGTSVSVCSPISILGAHWVHWSSSSLGGACTGASYHHRWVAGHQRCVRREIHGSCPCALHRAALDHRGMTSWNVRLALNRRTGGSGKMSFTRVSSSGKFFSEALKISGGNRQALILPKATSPRTSQERVDTSRYPFMIIASYEDPQQSLHRPVGENRLLCPDC